MRSTTVICVLGALAATVGCKPEAPKAPTQATEKSFTVYTTFYPTTYFVQRIGGELVEVVCPCPADADPAMWMPNDATIAAYQKADLIVINGASFEKWVSKTSLPEARIVDTSKSFSEELIVLPGAVSHSHGPGGEHTHEGVDGHTWVDPINAKRQADAILAALVARMPEKKQVLKDNHAALEKDFEALDARFKDMSAKIGDEQLLASHPAYNYLARRYGWQVKSFFLDPEEMPDEGTLTEIGTFLAEKPSRYILWEAQPEKAIEDVLRKKFGLMGIVFSPCESLDEEKVAGRADYLTVMGGNVDRVLEALSTEHRP
jgi:zinc transport system substrate-binding protein